MGESAEIYRFLKEASKVKISKKFLTSSLKKNARNGLGIFGIMQQKMS